MAKESRNWRFLGAALLAGCLGVLGLACSNEAAPPATMPVPVASSPATLPAAPASVPAAAQAKDEAPATDKAPAKDQAPAPAAIHASNGRALRAVVGQIATVEGRVSRTSTSSGGIVFLNLENSELSLVSFPDDAKKFFSAGPASKFQGQPIRVTGKIELYKGKLQIKLNGAAQLATVEEPAAAKSNAARVELKREGANSWRSPAGLRYAGHDPSGLSRLDHLRRHMRDDPERDGPHGVFDGEEDVAFAVIDEAWKRARERGLKPEVEGDRSSLVVPMGRRIGYLGGRTGNERRHPALEKVFIVFETGTTNIITAFPR